MDNKIRLYSEIGKLNAVLLHRPGIEIERMTPENAHEALYSDILNKRIVDGEYANLRRIDKESDDLKLVARALLPAEINEGSQLKYEMMEYELI